MYSIVIPLYNKEKYIARAIKSVLAQTYQEFEIIVINDGCTDNSANEVAVFDDDRIKIINQVNAGVSAARNRGILEAKQSFIAFLDADDEWYPDYLESIANLQGAYPECQVFATSYIYKDGEKSMLPNIAFKGTSGVIDNYFELACKGSPLLWTSAVTVSKKELISVGMFMDNVKSGEDLLLWAKLAQFCKIAYLNSAKAIYYFPVRIDVKLNIRMPDSKDIVYRELRKMYSVETRADIKRSMRGYIGHWCKIRLHIFSHNKKPLLAFNEYIKMIKFTPVNLKGLLLLIFAFLPTFIHNRVFSSKMNKMK